MKDIVLRFTKGCILLGMTFLIGCATTQDVKILDREIRRLESQWAQTQSRDQKEKDELRKELSTLRGELSLLKQEISSLRSEISSETQKLKADLLLRLESLQTETRILSTGVEEYKEYLKRPTREVDRLKGEVEARVRALEEKGKSHDEHFKEIAIRMKGIEEQLKWLEARWKSNEDRLKINEERLRTSEDRLKGNEERLKVMEGRFKGIEEGLKGIEAKLVTRPPEGEKSSHLEEKVSDLKGLSVRVGDLYREAYETFQRGDLEGARKKFEAFLSQYPHTELSDNAQFWIGETYFLKKDYEKAILEYEKVIVKYPEGDKVPSALLKQGLAFLELGDKTNARSLLKRVVERYPKTEQAEIAKKRLEFIK